MEEKEQKEEAKKLVSESEKADPKNLLDNFLLLDNFPLLDNFLLLDNSQMKNDLQNIEKIIKSVLIPQPYSTPLPN